MTDFFNRRCLCQEEIAQDRRGKAPEPAEGWENLLEMKRVQNSRVPADKVEAVVRIREPAQAGDREVHGGPDAELAEARAVAADEVDRLPNLIHKYLGGAYAIRRSNRTNGLRPDDG